MIMVSFRLDFVGNQNQTAIVSIIYDLINVQTDVETVMQAMLAE